MAGEPQRFVLGIAYQAGPDPRITKGADGGRDYFTKAELEKACWSFMRSGHPQMNAFHVDGTQDCAVPVESFIWRWDDWDAGDGIVVKDGDWLLGSILSPRMWSAHEAGKINGYSPEGTARRRRVAKEGAVAIAKGSAGPGDDDELTALEDANFPVVALVGKGANGIPRFLISKEDGGAGLLDPGFVRGLIGKQAGPDDSARERVTMPSGVTLTGSPADIAAFIHKAAERAAERDADDVAKAELSGKSKNDLPDSVFGYIEPGGHKDDEGKTTPRSLRHFPLNDEAHVRAALQDAPKSPFGDKAMPKIRAAAKRHGIDVSKEAGVPDTVTKDTGPELDEGVDGLDPTVPLAAPDEMGAGDVTSPGSPAWESVDAATAQKWCSILSRARVAVDLLAERELLEAASADPGDAENAWDLQDACCAIDYVISVLAPFAVAEQSEADCGEADLMAAVGKAAAALESVPFGTVEGLCAVAKSGRVLSAANEARIREAAGQLNAVLASLPRAPATDDGQAVAKGGAPVTATQTEPVAKDGTVASPEEQARDTGPVNAGGVNAMGTPKGGPSGPLPGDVPGREVLKSALALVYGPDGALVGVAESAAIVQRVAKADGDGEKKAMQAVFDQDGDLIGIVDPDAIQPVTGAAAKPGDDTPAADASDMTPQPPAAAGAPADGVAKAAAEEKDSIMVTQDVLKSIAQDAARTALEAQGAAHAEVVAKMAADNAGLAEKLETVTARLETVEKQDARPGVFANGAVPPPGAQAPPRPSLRGQDQGAQVVDVAKAAELKRVLSEGSGPEQVAAFNQLQAMTVAAHQQIRAAGRIAYAPLPE